MKGRICKSKIQYRTRKQAEEFARFLKRTKGVISYLYVCDDCLNWHLTTKPTRFSI